MQQPLLHSLLAAQSAWHELSFEMHVAPYGTPEPVWQHCDGDEQDPPGAVHVGVQ
jgi:hypothetical protein